MGLVSGSALIIGALVAYFASVPSRVIAFVMSFGSGVLISALSFELMEEGFTQGGSWPTAFGFVAGATVYTFANVWLSRRGAKHRKRSGDAATLRRGTAAPRSRSGRCSTGSRNWS